jgi:hypothetical protein
MIYRQPVGTVVSTTDEMQLAVATFMRDDERWAAAGRLAKRYVGHSHSVAVAVRTYERLFAELAQGAVPTTDVVIPTAST